MLETDGISKFHVENTLNSWILHELVTISLIVGNWGWNSRYEIFFIPPQCLHLCLILLPLKWINIFKMNTAFYVKFQQDLYMLNFGPGTIVQLANQILGSHVATGVCPGCFTSKPTPCFLGLAKQWRITQSFGTLSLSERPRRSPWLLASDQPSSGSCNNLESESVDQRSIFVSLYLHKFDSPFH